jgi:hypothetical protein
MARSVLSWPGTMTRSQGCSILRVGLGAAMLFVLGCGSGSGGALQGSGGMTGGAGGSGGMAGVGGGNVAGNGGGGAGGGGGGGGGPGGGGAGPGGGGGGATPVAGSPCESNSDCGSALFLVCRAPGEFLGCGTCQQGQSTCGRDTDCGGSHDGGVAVAHMICDVAPSSQCYCTGVMICQVGCRASSDCAAGQGCNAHHQCQDTCTPGSAACPTNASCSADGFCTQNTCTEDSQCSGACVKGGCYSTRGTCQPLPA